MHRSHAENIVTFEEQNILVQDDGDGFIEQDKSHAFEPFYTTKSSGTGLGLSICRQELELCKTLLRILILGEQRLQYSFECKSVTYRDNGSGYRYTSINCNK